MFENKLDFFLSTKHFIVHSYCLTTNPCQCSVAVLKRQGFQ